MSVLSSIAKNFNPTQLVSGIVGGTVGKVAGLAANVVSGIARGKSFGEIMKTLLKDVASLAITAAVTYFTGGTAGLFINSLLDQAKGLLGKVAAQVASSALAKPVAHWVSSQITGFAETLTQDLVRKELTRLVLGATGLKDETSNSSSRTLMRLPAATCSRPSSSQSSTRRSRRTRVTPLRRRSSLPPACRSTRSKCARHSACSSRFTTRGRCARVSIDEPLAVNSWGWTTARRLRRNVRFATGGRNMNFVRVGLSVALGALVWVGCGGQEEDTTQNLTGTESQPLTSTSEDGGTVYSCPPEKALVCHVPPGNPANAHTICVGKPAVKAHLKNHPDSEGSCDGEQTVVDAGTPDEGSDAGTEEPRPSRSMPAW